MKEEVCKHCAYYNTKRYLNGNNVMYSDSTATCLKKHENVSYWSRCSDFTPCKEYQELLNKQIEKKNEEKLKKQRMELEEQQKKELKKINDTQFLNQVNEPIDHSKTMEFLQANSEALSEMMKREKRKAKILTIICICSLFLGILGFGLVAVTKGNGFCIALGGIGSIVFVIVLAAILIRKFGK